MCLKNQNRDLSNQQNEVPSQNNNKTTANANKHENITKRFPLHINEIHLVWAISLAAFSTCIIFYPKCLFLVSVLISEVWNRMLEGALPPRTWKLMKDECCTILTPWQTVGLSLLLADWENIKCSAKLWITAFSGLNVWTWIRHFHKLKMKAKYGVVGKVNKSLKGGICKYLKRLTSINVLIKSWKIILVFKA